MAPTDRRVEPDHAAQRAAEDRADRDRAPHDEAHRGVHPALHPRRRDRLAEAHLVDVVDRRRRTRRGTRTGRRANGRSEPSGAMATRRPDRLNRNADQRRWSGPTPSRVVIAVRVTSADEEDADRPDREGEADRRRPEPALADEVQDQDRAADRAEEVGGAGRRGDAAQVAVAGHVAQARRRSPCASTAGPCASSSCGDAGGSGRRIKKTKSAETT